MSVRVPATDRYRSLCIMLCMALMMVFAAASLSSAIDRIQHAPGAPAEHEHMIISDFSAEEAEADHHRQAPDEDAPAEHLAGGHHHHADGGAGIAVHGPGDADFLASSAAPHGIEPDAHHAGIGASGPEHPPKLLTMDA